MAEVFRPTYYVDPSTGKRATKSFPGVVRKKSPTYWIRYYLPFGERKKVKGYRDRKATEALAVQLEKKAAREAEGIFDPTDEQTKRPLAEHAKDFRRCLTAKGNTGAYVELILFRLTALLDACHFVRIADVQPSGVLSFLADLRESGKSLKTANEYLAAMKGFTRWLWRDKRTAVDPLAGLPRLASKGEADIRHARRDFAPEELQRLLAAARRSTRVLRKLSGTDRYFLYLAACATGFRANELASLTPDSFNLDTDPPTVTIESSCAKNRREAVQPLPSEVARALAGYLQDKAPGVPVWPGKWKSRAFLMVRADLEAARDTWLSEAVDAYQRAEREKTDFLNLSGLRRPLRRLPRLATFVHHDGGQSRRLSERTSGPGPAFHVCPDRPLHPFAVLRSCRRGPIATDPVDGPRDPGRDGHR
jgi:integrase